MSWKVPHADAAFKSFFDFLHIVLEAAQGIQRSFMHDDAVAHDARFGAAGDFAFQDKTAADRAALGELVDHADFGASETDFRLFRLQEPFHRRAHVGDGFINDPVGFDFDVRFAGRFFRLGVRTAR